MSASDEEIVQRKRKLEETFDFTLLKKFKNEDEIPDVDFINIPAKGTLVDRRNFRRAGCYILGPKVGISPVESIGEYLAKKEGTNEFVQLKVYRYLCNKSPDFSLSQGNATYRTISF